MFDEKLALRAMGIAAGITACSLLVFAWPWRAPHRSRLILGWTLGLGVGFVAGCLILHTTINLPFAKNAEATDRLFLVVLPAVMLIEGLSSIGRMPRGLIWLPRVFLTLFAAKILLHNSIYLEDLPGSNGPEWTPREQWTHFLVLAGALVIVWAALEALLRTSPSRSVPLAMSVVCVGSAVTIMCSATASGGQLALPLAGALAGGFLASCLLPAARGGNGFLGVGLVVLFSLLIIGRYFAQLTDKQGSVLLFSLLLCWLPEFPYLRKLRSSIREGLRVLVVALPIALVTGQAWEKFQEDSKQNAQPGEPTMEDYGNFKQ
jgi:hypothetical protein